MMNLAAASLAVRTRCQRVKFSLLKKVKEANSDQANENSFSVDSLFQIVEKKSVTDVLDFVEEWKTQRACELREERKLERQAREMRKAELKALNIPAVGDHTPTEISSVDQVITLTPSMSTVSSDDEDNVFSDNFSVEDQAYFDIIHSRKRVTKKTLLMHCCELGLEELVYVIFRPFDKFLTEAFINLKDINGNTALTYACRRNRTRLAEFLFANGLDVRQAIDKRSLKNDNFWTFVVKNSNVKMVEAIRKHIQTSKNWGEFADTQLSRRSVTGNVTMIGLDMFDVNLKCFKNM